MSHPDENRHHDLVVSKVDDAISVLILFGYFCVVWTSLQSTPQLTQTDRFSSQFLECSFGDNQCRGLREECCGLTASTPATPLLSTMAGHPLISAPAFDGPDSDPDPTSSSRSDFRVSSLTIAPSIFRVVTEYLGLHRERYLGKVQRRCPLRCLFF